MKHNNRKHIEETTDIVNSVKKQWNVPEIYELDIFQTQGKRITSSTEGVPPGGGTNFCKITPIPIQCSIFGPS